MKIRSVAFSANGCKTSIKLKELLNEDVEIWCKTSSDTYGVPQIECGLHEWTKKAFEECDAIISIGAVGIAVRHIAPFIKSKTTDPAVICMDEHAKFTIPLLSGHIGGGNALASRIAILMDSEPVITTATDINNKFSVDTFAVANGLRISSMQIAKETSARVLDGRFVGLSSDMSLEGNVPEELTLSDSGEFGICISSDGRSPFDRTLKLVPKDIVIGVGCKKNVDPEKLSDFVTEVLSEEKISTKDVFCVASIDIKSKEKAILALADSLNVPTRFFSSSELNSLEGEFTSSDFVKSVTGVDSVCERSAIAVSGGNLLRKKTARDGMTIALCRREIKPRFLI